MFKVKKTSAKKISRRKDRLLDEDSPFSLVEAFRNIKTNLAFSTTKKEGQGSVIVITSSIPEEGKSTISTNLAYTCASTSSKVLLIDADLRSPRVNKFFEFKNDFGLSNYLSGQAQLEEIIKPSNTKNLDIILSGFRPPNPNELLSNSKMKELIEQVEKTYDYIIIDTPPISAVSDCLVVAPLTDGVVIITKSMFLTHPSLQATIKKLEFAKCKILGVVLNDVEIKARLKYYKSHYGSYYLGKDK